MASIRTHIGPTDLCESCGQPCYFDNGNPKYGSSWMHFGKREDGVTCQSFPFAGEPLDGIQEARDEHSRSLIRDARWKQLKAADRRYMRALLASHDPLTGYLEYQIRTLGLTELLEVSEEALRQSRLRLIEAGLIVSYEPGSGRTASTYRIARSWEEADEAAANRR